MAKVTSLASEGDGELHLEQSQLEQKWWTNFDLENERRREKERERERERERD